MTGPGRIDPADAKRRIAAFLRGEGPGRLLRFPTGHPARPTGFCYCDASPLGMIGTYLKGVLLAAVLNLPWNGLKVGYLRRLGARLGRDVFISVGAWIDPLYPQLLVIEDGVFIGTGARIVLHEFRVDEFRLGRVVLRRGSFVGGFSLIACGVEVGENAVVAGGAVVALDVPPGTVATGNPAFYYKRAGKERKPEKADG